MADWLRAARTKRASAPSSSARRTSTTAPSTPSPASPASTPAAGVRLLVNGRLDVALAAGADGVHLPADGVPVAALRARFGPGVLIGRSDPYRRRGRAGARRGRRLRRPSARSTPTPGKGAPVGLAGELARAAAGRHSRLRSGRHYTRAVRRGGLGGSGRGRGHPAVPIDFDPQHLAGAGAGPPASVSAALDCTR